MRQERRPISLAVVMLVDAPVDTDGDSDPAALELTSLVAAAVVVDPSTETETVASLQLATVQLTSLAVAAMAMDPSTETTKSVWRRWQWWIGSVDSDGDSSLAAVQRISLAVAVAPAAVGPSRETFGPVWRRLRRWTRRQRQRQWPRCSPVDQCGGGDNGSGLVGDSGSATVPLISQSGGDGGESGLVDSDGDSGLAAVQRISLAVVVVVPAVDA